MNKTIDEKLYKSNYKAMYEICDLPDVKFKLAENFYDMFELAYDDRLDPDFVEAVSEFTKRRQDSLISDRECAAAMATYIDFDVKKAFESAIITDKSITLPEEYAKKLALYNLNFNKTFKCDIVPFTGNANLYENHILVARCNVDSIEGFDRNIDDGDVFAKDVQLIVNAFSEHKNPVAERWGIDFSADEELIKMNTAVSLHACGPIWKEFEVLREDILSDLKEEHKEVVDKEEKSVSKSRDDDFDR